MYEVPPRHSFRSIPPRVTIRSARGELRHAHAPAGAARRRWVGPSRLRGGAVRLRCRTALAMTGLACQMRERIANARTLSGTRCSRFAFTRSAETVHTAPAVSISSPRRQPDLTRPRRGQHQILERQLDRRLRRLRRPHRLDGGGHVLVGQRPMVRHDVVLRAEHRQNPIARIVVAQLHRDRPLRHRPDALAHGAPSPPCCARSASGSPERRPC